MASTSGPNPPPCNLPPCNPPACKPPSCKPSPCKSLPCPAGCPPPPLYDTSQCSTSLDRPIPTKNQPKYTYNFRVTYETLRIKLLNCSSNRRWPKCVLGISKLSALEFLKAAHPDLSNNQLLSRLRKHSINPDEILTEHHRQLACEKELARILRNLDVSYRIMKRCKDNLRGFSAPHLQPPAIVFEPHRQRFATVEVTEDLSAPINLILMQIVVINFLFNALMRSTQRKIADALQPRWRILPWLALNEVFVVEFLASRSITMVIQIRRSRSVPRVSASVKDLVSRFRTMNLQTAKTIQAPAAMATGRKVDEKEIREVSYKYHKNLLFPPDNELQKRNIFRIFNDILLSNY
ncbi:LOW QUALITY PROTEIN: uncharacterized protein [Cardiocondyla obscurior]|uniref:LOW QUALITY PROTEIN: uncharacterized protein n=1 Tax=Cardiocondyla obscurior TaxID=286306 RepID=UPI0039658399